MGSIDIERLPDLQSVHLAIEWHQLACLLPVYLLACIASPGSPTYVPFAGCQNSCKWHHHVRYLLPKYRIAYRTLTLRG